MPCDPLVSDGKVVGFVCGPGVYQHLINARCPWCCLGEDRTTHAFREVHGGYCAPDLICECGQSWSADMDYLPRLSEEKREENADVVKVLLALGRVPGPMPVPFALEDL